MNNLFTSTVRLRLRRWLFIILKILFPALLLYLLNKHGYLDFMTIARIELSSTIIFYLAAMLLLVLASLAVIAVRLQILLAPHGIHPGFIRSLGVTLIGALSGSVLPGMIAGDVVKAIYLFGDSSERRSSSVSAVLIDRLVGLFSLVLLGACASLTALLSGHSGNIRTILLFSITLLAVLLVSGTAFMYLILGPGRRTYRRLRDRLPRKFVALTTSLFLYRHHPALLIQATLLSVFSHAMIVATFIIAAEVLKVPLGIGLHMILDPVAMLLNAVPIAPGGLGITESGFAYLYQLSGSAAGAAVSLAGRFAQYTVFIVGGFWALFSLRRRIKQHANPQREII
ncbi:MAG: lysylphosphatidylglycerol synthase transmembrane domain-containing protein [Gammaproteobacteria bacterium]